MSKRKKKRGGGRSPYEGYETEVWGSSPIQIAAIEKEYRSMEEESFQMGKAFKAHIICKVLSLEGDAV